MGNDIKSATPTNATPYKHSCKSCKHEFWSSARNTLRCEGCAEEARRKKQADNQKRYYHRKHPEAKVGVYKTGSGKMRQRTCLWCGCKFTPEEGKNNRQCCSTECERSYFEAMSRPERHQSPELRRREVLNRMSTIKTGNRGVIPGGNLGLANCSYVSAGAEWASQTR